MQTKPRTGSSRGTPTAAAPRRATAAGPPAGRSTKTPKRTPARAGADPARVASELRVVIGGLTRRLRAEHRFPLTQGAVLGRLDRGGALSVSELATAERVRPQSMAQTVSELEAEGLVARRPDPEDGRRALVALTEQGTTALHADRRHREGWLARAIAEELSDGEQATLDEAVELLRRLAES